MVINTEHIWTDSKRCSGNPCVRDTRFTIEQLLAELTVGHIEDVAHNFEIDVKILNSVLHELGLIISSNT